MILPVTLPGNPWGALLRLNGAQFARVPSEQAARHAETGPELGLTANLGNIALLKIAADLDLISVKSAEQCRTANSGGCSTRCA